MAQNTGAGSRSSCVYRNSPELPGGKIGITRGLLAQLESEAELAAVLSHQIAHAVARHGAKAVERNIVKDVAVTTAAIGATFFGVPLIAAVPLVIRKGSTGDWLTHRSHSKSQEIEADAELSPDPRR